MSDPTTINPKILRDNTNLPSQVLLSDKTTGTQPSEEPEPFIPLVVIFLLDSFGHEGAGYNPKEAEAIYELSKKYANSYINDSIKEHQTVLSDMVKQFKKQKPEDFFEIRSFNALYALTINRPRRTDKWIRIVLVTHSGAGIKPNSIFMGDDAYNAYDLKRYTRENLKEVEEFREQFAKQSTLTLIICGAGLIDRKGLACAVRDFFGVEGEVSLPQVDVDFDIDTGRLGTPVIGGKKKETRKIYDNEFMKVRTCKNT